MERRIVVATSSAQATSFTIGIAANLAAIMEARLEALFVEDISLLRLAALPFATELHKTSGTPHDLNLPDISIALQQQANLLRRKMQDVVQNTNLQTKLRVARGDFITEAFSAESDVLFISPAIQMSNPGFQALKPARLRTLIPKANQSVYVYLQPELATKNTVFMTISLAKILECQLVFLLSENHIGLVNRIKALFDNSEKTAAEIRFELVDANPAHAMSHSAKKGCALFITSRSAFTNQIENQEVQRSMGCPIVLIA